MIGVNNGTALHRATSGGDLSMVQRLVEKGADLNDRNNPFGATPISWAEHVHQQEVFDWMRAHCPVDLHDAVCFDLPEHVEARLAADPGAVDRAIDQWHVPGSTPLYWAAYLGKTHLARRLLEKGADPNRLAGDGHTTLDIAEDKGRTETAALLAPARRPTGRGAVSNGGTERSRSTHAGVWIKVFRRVATPLTESRKWTILD